MQDDGAGESGECVESRLVGGPGVETTGLPSSAASASWPRRDAVVRHAARSRGSGRARSRRRRRRGRGRGAPGARRASARRFSRVVGVDAEGCVDTVLGPASSSAARHESIVVPTVITRSTPAARARSSTTEAGSEQASRCAWVSIIAAGSARPSARARPRPPSPGRASRRGASARPAAARAGARSAPTVRTRRS